MFPVEDYTKDPKAKPCQYCGVLTRGVFGEFGTFCSRPTCLDEHDAALDLKYSQPRQSGGRSRRP